MRTVVSTKGQIVIPAELREADGIACGDQFDVEKVRPGQYLVRRVKERPNKGLAASLLACPVKDFFQPIPSESTDTL